MVRRSVTSQLHAYLPVQSYKVLRKERMAKMETMQSVKARIAPQANKSSYRLLVLFPLSLRKAAW
eukprot:718409-Amphidinium_carterae.1